MAKLKRVTEISFILIVAAAVLTQAAVLYLRWKEARRIRAEIWQNAHVAVVKSDPRFPPGLLVEYENASRYKIATTHFRLTLEVGVQEVARTDRDYREMKPGEKESVLLQSVAASPVRTLPPGTKVTYHLLVFPDQRKPLPEVRGEIELR
jgi:hypothetical protein